ncbi:S8 family serine peptidase [Bradyrhizobium manausense]|nr:S8 family serine peptidase [Bradyrhizobium manausense]
MCSVHEGAVTLAKTKRSKKRASKAGVTRKATRVIKSRAYAAVPKLPAAQPAMRFQYLPAWATLVATSALSPTAASSATVAAAAALASQTVTTSDELKTRLSSGGGRAMSDLKPLPIKVSPEMDPRLQLALANFRTGKRGPELASTTGDEVAVVARVRSVEEWRAIPDVDPGAELGKDHDGSWIVTGRLAVKRVEAVRGEATVLSLKASQPVRPSLKATIETMGVARDSLPAGVSRDGGKGVVVGIVDFGCDFAHRNFCLADGRTRIEAIWNQGANVRAESPVKYGRLITRADIDGALASGNPYVSLGYGPPNAPGGTHGTHVMDIAAGNGNGSGQSGVAPQADLVFVEVATSDIAWQGPTTVNQAFGDSVQLLEAVRFVFDAAGDRPCVCNISLGTNGGPHDGSSLVEKGLDAIVREKPNRAIVIAASNSQTDNIHTSGTVEKGEAHSITIRQQSAGGGEFELWYPGARRLEVTLTAPDGTIFGPVAPGDNLSVGSPGRIAIFISSRLDDPNNHDNVIGIWIASDLSEGDFVVGLRTVDDEPADYHAWMERDDQTQASFARPVPTHNLGSISTGMESIAVGSFDGHKPTFPISSFSSAGPTRDGRNKPEVSAPGQFVIAAKSGSGTGTTKKSGTSMAAPAITGLIALIFAEAQRKGQPLSIAQLRTKLTSTADANPPPGGGAWDARYGFGRANGRAVP